MDKTLVNEALFEFLQTIKEYKMGRVLIIINIKPFQATQLIDSLFKKEFIPRYTNQEDKLHSISKIYVDSEISVDNRRSNREIPKEYSEFKFESLSNRIEKVTVKRSDSKPIFEATFKLCRIPFPVNTSLLPFHLVQQYNNKEYRTKFEGKGMSRFARMTDLKSIQNSLPISNR